MSNQTFRPSIVLTKILEEQHETLLANWLEQQLASDYLRLDLMDEAELRSDCVRLLDVLRPAFASQEPFDPDQDSWSPVTDFLREVSIRRDEAGFSPIETANFVLSIKEPLISIVDQETSDAVRAIELWGVSEVFDGLAFYTTEVYRTRREDTIQQQREEMEELSTPVVELWNGILAMPLIGTLDTYRGQMVSETLLGAIAESGAEMAILDLTGVPAIDTRMAQHLIRAVAAARLMGTECILSGIRPQIAQTIVHLQIQLGNIRTTATLSGALRQAFRQRGLKVVDADGGPSVQ